jgi:predicted Ser/Thr protein kinase
VSDDSRQPAVSPPCLPVPTVRSRRRPEDGPLPQAVGRFQVLERIGAGAMGVVYKCRQPGLDRPVAVKVLLAAQHAAAEDLHRFQREARAAARLSHPNVVQIYDVGSDGELPYFVMEYVDGCALDQLIGTPVLTLVNALRVLAAVARALQAAHDQGIVHRDLKPSNILIHRSGQPKLADFGLARSLQDSQVLSASGDLVGTPRYMAPEQVLGEPDAVDARADVYALGVLLYEMVAGRPPVDGPTPLAVFRQLLDGEPPDLRAACPGAPDEIAAVCRRAMARDKEARFASAAEFAEAVEGYLLRHVLGKGEAADLPRAREMLAALPPLVLPAPPRRPGWRGKAAMLVPVGLAAVAAAALLAGLGMVFGAFRHPPATYPVSAGEVDNLPAVRARVVAKAHDQLRGPLALPGNATPRDVLRGLMEDLTAVLKRAPEDDEVRLLHARAERRAGEHLAAADDLTPVLHRQPDNLDAATERLLAEYEFYVLYFGNLDEPALRPPFLEHLLPDLEALRRRGSKGDQGLADLVQALARRDYGKAAGLASPDPPPRVGLPDWAMLTADALFTPPSRRTTRSRPPRRARPRRRSGTCARTWPAAPCTSSAAGRTQTPITSACSSSKPTRFTTGPRGRRRRARTTTQ